MSDDLLDSVFQNCNLLWGKHDAFDKATEGARLDEFFDMVMMATQMQSDLLAAAARLGIDLTSFSAWLVIVQKAHEKLGRTAQLDERADDSWPSVHAAIQRLRYAAGAAIERAARGKLRSDAAPEPADAQAAQGAAKADDATGPVNETAKPISARPERTDAVLQFIQTSKFILRCLRDFKRCPAGTSAGSVDLGGTIHAGNPETFQNWMQIWAKHYQLAYEAAEGDAKLRGDIFNLALPFHENPFSPGERPFPPPIQRKPPPDGDGGQTFIMQLGHGIAFARANDGANIQDFVDKLAALETTWAHRKVVPPEQAGSAHQAAAKPVPATAESGYLVRDKVFISYSHRDKVFLEQLLTHLKPLERAGRVSAWSDKQLEPGSKWRDEIAGALALSKVAVLLVTKDFLASDFINENELGPLLKEAERGGVRILWVLVRACSYKETPLKDYQAIIPPDKPLAEMKAERDRAWVAVCKAIRCEVIGK